MASVAKVLDLDMARTTQTTDIQRLFDAITNSERSVLGSLGTVDRSVATLQEKVTGMGSQIATLSNEMQSIRSEKASVPELRAVESRAERSVLDAKAEFSRELARVESAVDKDVQAFEGMYDNVIAEMKEIREGLGGKLESLAISLKELGQERRAQDEKLKGIDERLAKIEPLRDTWLKALGARWAIGVLSAILSSGVTLAIAKILFGVGK